MTVEAGAQTLPEAGLDGEDAHPEVAPTAAELVPTGYTVITLVMVEVEWRV